MEHVGKAIVMAAGRGNRLRPLTDTVPKPLIEVNGKRMIEGIVETLLGRGVGDIVLVVGYLGAQFLYLKEKYGVRLVFNPDHARANNISSLYYAREELNASCVILDGDQLFNIPEAVKTRFKHSGYACWYTKDRTDEWLMKLSRGGAVRACSRTGGPNGWELKSLSYWTEEDAKKLAFYVKEEYEKGNTGVYWDDVAMFLHREKFDLYAHRIPRGAITEIDGLDDLAAADGRYAKVKENMK